MLRETQDCVLRQRGDARWSRGWTSPKLKTVSFGRDVFFTARQDLRTRMPNMLVEQSLRTRVLTDGCSCFPRRGCGSDRHLPAPIPRFGHTNLVKGMNRELETAKLLEGTNGQCVKCHMRAQAVTEPRQLTGSSVSRFRRRTAVLVTHTDFREHLSERRGCPLWTDISRVRCKS